METKAIVSRYGVTVQPIVLHVGAVASFSPVVPPVGGGGTGGNGGGAALLLPLIAVLFVPLLASGPPGVPTASGPGQTPTEVTPAPPAPAPLTPAVTLASGGKSGITALAAPPVTATPPRPGRPIVVLPQGPTAVRAVPRGPGVLARSPTPPRRHLPFTGAELWPPIVAGLELISMGVVFWQVGRAWRSIRRHVP
jgi:hypothetical protein